MVILIALKWPINWPSLYIGLSNHYFKLCFTFACFKSLVQKRIRNGGTWAPILPEM